MIGLKVNLANICLLSMVKKDKKIVPAITHIDGTARVQTVERQISNLLI